MIQIDKPITRTFWKITSADGTVIHTGITEPDQVTTSGQDVLQTDAEITAEGLQELPSEGKIEAGMYAYNGKVVICVQPHDRTIYEPFQTPALFTFFRENSEDLEWIENEKVETGWKRWYNGVQFECIQPHLTLVGSEPDVTIALWNIYYAEGEIIDWYAPTGAHDAFRIDTLMRYTDGKVYKSLIDYNTYSPEAYPSSWELQPDLT